MDISSVCMFSNLYPPVVSGSSTQTCYLARELVRRGCQVAVITAHIAPESKAYEQDNGVHVYRLPALRLPKMAISLNFPWLNCTFTPGNLRRIESILERHRPDVLHLHNHMFDLAFSAAVMSRRTKRPLVITIHTVIKHARGFYNLLLYPADRFLLGQFVVKPADAVICPDVNVEDYVRKTFGRTDGALVPYGISLPEALADDVEELRQKYHLDSRRVILSLGHVHEIRDRRDLIEALPEVLRTYPDTVLLIAGAISTESPAALARRLGVHASVVFTGHVSHAQVPALLAVADIETHWLNQDTPDKTSLGVASLEGMCAGKTVLAAANENSYGPGVLRNGENVVLVEPGKPRELAQRIVSLLGDRDRCAAIGLQARRTIQEHFSWASVGAKTLAVYREAAQKRSPRQPASV